MTTMKTAISRDYAINRPLESPPGHQVAPAAVGVKYDSDKPRYELLAPEALEGTAQVLTFGAKKYSDRNWEHGMRWSRVFGALMRHLWAWWRGQHLDEETGLSHLHHAACCVMFLQAYEARHVGNDDRPSNPNSSMQEGL